VDRHAFIERYCDVRSWFDQLVRFAEAAREELAPDSPIFAHCDYDNWMGQMHAYQLVCCERCGAFLQRDALGLGAYTIEPFSRICGICYDEVTRREQGSRRRLARLTAYAQEQPQLFVGLLVEAQRRLGLDDWELESCLRLEGAGIVRLALAQRPRVGHEDEDLVAIAGMAGCSATLLHRLLTEETMNATDAARAGVWHESA
jgi:hypothetical protein